MRLRRSAGAIFLMSAFAGISSPAIVAGEGPPEKEGLATFKTWLDRKHPGYGCDEGPAEFRNEKVAAAYPDRRFYFVLTRARGIRPPFPNAVSLVAWIDGAGEVRTLDSSSPETFRAGLMRVSSTEEARRAAAAVLILAFGDPGEGRWKFDGGGFAVKKSRQGWLCRYEHGDAYHVSEVVFDRHGALTAIRANPPPVP